MFDDFQGPLTRRQRGRQSTGVAVRDRTRVQSRRLRGWVATVPAANSA